jgi:hypothetical protein
VEPFAWISWELNDSVVITSGYFQVPGVNQSIDGADSVSDHIELAPFVFHIRAAR